MNCWIFQGSPDHFDVDQYLRRTHNVYWSVTRPKHQRDIALGDVVYLWRASGRKGSIAGVVARAIVVERCKPRSELDNPIWLYDELWRGGASERSPIKAGLAVEEVRLTREQGMVQRSDCLADSVLAHSQIIRTRVGSNFRLSELEQERLDALWSGRRARPGSSPAGSTDSGAGIAGEGAEPVLLLNNCAGRRHARLFGAGAFFDLFLTGTQSEYIGKLYPGLGCIVAAKEPGGVVRFDHHILERCEELPDNEGRRCVVLFGVKTHEDRMAKSAASSVPPVCGLFNVSGDFKQQAALFVDAEGKTIPVRRISDAPSGGGTDDEHGSGGGDYAPTADEEELNRRTVRILRTRLTAEPVGITQPKRRDSSQQTYERSPLVKAWVLQRAAGTCEYCAQPGPFRDAMGQLFLEVHHITPLADGGHDTTRNAVALCPNCHRRCHYAEDAKEVREKLAEHSARLEGMAIERGNAHE
jgi:5-methylcytosine-specific restriction endonuclease McrA